MQKQEKSHLLNNLPVKNGSNRSYKVAPTLDGIAYEDTLYGNSYDNNSHRTFFNAVNIEKIVMSIEALQGS